MSNLNSVSEIQKIVASISIISVSISSVQRVQKHKIHFEIKYFNEKFNLSKSNQSCDYDNNSTDNEDSDNKESDQKSNNNTVKSTYLVLLAALHQSDSLIYSEAIQNAHTDDEISSSDDEVFATKEQLADLCMKDLVELTSYKEVMNSCQCDY